MSLLLFLGRIFISYFDIITEFDPENYNLANRVYWAIGISFQIFALACFFILIEIRVVKGRDKYILVILYFISYLYAIITINILFIMVCLIIVLYIPIAYAYVAIISDGIVRIRAIFVSLGIVLFLIANAIVAGFLVQALGVELLLMHTISNFIKIGAVILLYFGFHLYSYL